MVGECNFEWREVLRIHVAVEQADWVVGLIVDLQPDRLDILFSKWAIEILLRFGIGQDGDRNDYIVFLLGDEMLLERRSRGRARHRGASAPEHSCQGRGQRKPSSECNRASRFHISWTASAEKVSGDAGL